MAFDPDALDNRDPAWIAGLSRLVEATLERWHRAEVRGLEHLPAGAALLVGNHSGGLLVPDLWLAMAAAFRARGVDAVPHALGHDRVMTLPVLGPFLARLGGVRASPANAHRILAGGGKLLVYPGGDLDTFRAWRDRDRVIFGGRRGFMRLALREGVPVVPVVAAGAHETFLVLSDGRRLARRLRADRLLRIKAWPTILSIPWGLTVGPIPPHLPLPTRILVEILPAMTFERTGPEAAADDAWVDACAGRVREAMEAALRRLQAERRAVSGRSRGPGGGGAPGGRGTRR